MAGPGRQLRAEREDGVRRRIGVIGEQRRANSAYLAFRTMRSETATRRSVWVEWNVKGPDQWDEYEFAYSVVAMFDGTIVVRTGTIALWPATAEWFAHDLRECAEEAQRLNALRRRKRSAA